MASDRDLKVACSVSDMARRLNLSRARFYQLVETGVFPKPLYCVRTKRPYYSLELQQKCIEVRRTGIGYDGRPILFYSPRTKISNTRRSQLGSRLERLADALNRMGLNVSQSKVKETVETLYPGKLPLDVDEGVIIRNLFRFLLRDCKNDA